VIRSETGLLWAAAVKEVEMDRVRGLEAMHASPEIRPRCLHDQVEVIGQEAEQVQPHLESSHALAQHTQEMLPVGVVAKDLAPLVAAGRHMVHSPFVLDPLRPRHTPILLAPAPLRQHFSSLQACFNA
jgi:hypothetical protein